MSDITKEELLTMIDVQSKTATAMEAIANSMRQITEQNKEIVSAQKSIVDGCGKCQMQTCEKLVTAVDKKIDEKIKPIDEAKADIKIIRGDTAFMKWVFGGVGLVVGIALVVLKLIGH